MKTPGRPRHLALGTFPHDLARVPPSNVTPYRLPAESKSRLPTRSRPSGPVKLNRTVSVHWPSAVGDILVDHAKAIPATRTRGTVEVSGTVEDDTAQGISAVVDVEGVQHHEAPLTPG
jgi:hypothetical protein